MSRAFLARPAAAALLSALLLPVASAGGEPALRQDAEPEEGMTQEELEAVAAEIEKEVEALRGAAFQRPVAVRVATAEELKQYMLRRIEKTTEPGELQAEESVAKLLGLIPADLDVVESLFELIDSQAGGFYDPDEEAFYLMAQFADTGVTRTIIAHELTHALDDQVFSIDGIGAELADNGDAELAFHAVVEGSGTVIMQRWSMERLKGGEITMKEMMEAGDMGLDELAAMPEYMWKPLLASYLVGQTFLGRTKSLMAASMKPATNEDIDAAFRSPPRSTEQILHPEKYWDPEQRDDPRAVQLDASGVPDGWTVRHRNTLGELGLALVTTPPAERAKIDPANPAGIMGLRYTNDAASGWGGDRYVLLERDGAQVLYGLTVWDAPEERAEFEAALGEPGFAAARAEMMRALEPEEGAAGFELLDASRPSEDAVAFLAWRGTTAEEARAVARSVRASVGD